MMGAMMAVVVVEGGIVSWWFGVEVCGLVYELRARCLLVNDS